MGNAFSPSFTSPDIGAATGTSLLVSGIFDGRVPVTVTNGSSATLGGTYKSGYTFNQETSPGAAVTYTLPRGTSVTGQQYCVSNSYNGSFPTSGKITIQAYGTGSQYIIFTDGTLSANNGYVQSGGAAGDAACVIGVDSSHW